MAKVSKVQAGNDLKKAIEKAISDIEGLEKFITAGDRVLIKPNINTADPYPASTDPRFLRLLVEIVYKRGASEVIIGDSSTFSQSTTANIQKLGIDTFEKDMSPAPKVISFDKHKRIKKKITNGRYMKAAAIPEILEKVDKLIWAPCLKTHFLAQYTGALKLAVGLTSRKYKLLMHTGHLQEKIAELNTLFNPTLIVMDARKCYISGGPSSGVEESPGVILASTGRVAIDIEGVRIIKGFRNNSLQDIDPYELPQIKKAIELGIE